MICIIYQGINTGMLCIIYLIKPFLHIVVSPFFNSKLFFHDAIFLDQKSDGIQLIALNFSNY